MTALEEQVRAGLRHVDALPVRWPHPGAWKWCAPDVTVFGPQQPEPSEVADYPVILRTCRACGVQWRSESGCWCCGAGVKPL